MEAPRYRGSAVPVAGEQAETACCYHDAKSVSSRQTASRTRYMKRWNNQNGNLICVD